MKFPFFLLFSPGGFNFQLELLVNFWVIDSGFAPYKGKVRDVLGIVGVAPWCFSLRSLQLLRWGLETWEVFKKL